MDLLSFAHAPTGMEPTTCNLGMFSDQELNLQPFHAQDDAQLIEPLWQDLFYFYFFMCALQQQQENKCEISVTIR